jgi:hypothetical protein
MSCCLCGQGDDDGGQVRYCPACKHAFCDTCRELYFERGLAAMKQFLTRKPPAHCRGHEEHS